MENHQALSTDTGLRLERTVDLVPNSLAYDEDETASERCKISWIGCNKKDTIIEQRQILH